MFHIRILHTQKISIKAYCIRFTLELICIHVTSNYESNRNHPAGKAGL